MSKLSIAALSFFIIVMGSMWAAAEIMVQNSDGETLGVISMIDQNEIQAAQIAAQKKVDQQILDYAKMLNKEHSEHLVLTKQLAQKLGIRIVDNTPSILQLQTKGEEELVALNRLDGVAFEQMYIADMIKGHSEALNWIDSQGTQKEDLKKFLHDTRGHVAMHLQKAQEIQKDQNIGQT